MSTMEETLRARAKKQTTVVLQSSQLLILLDGLKECRESLDKTAE